MRTSNSANGYRYIIPEKPFFMSSIIFALARKKQEKFVGPTTDETRAVTGK
jgi:hypothetical protein